MHSTVINAVAPIRICDLGGWTDTWFADEGTVFNIGVYPYAEVQIHAVQRTNADQRRIVLNAENFGDRYELGPGKIQYDRHPLLEACIDIMELPEELSFEINLYSEAPAGASTGTSAAVSVALIGGLDLLTPGSLTPHEVAALAHRVETECLGLQCGIQDQLCSAYGGLNFMEMFHYPKASVSPVSLPNSTWWELERRLVLVFLGNAHSSSAVHGQVIARLEKPGADRSMLEEMRRLARKGKDALSAGDFEAFGEAMIANTEAQRALHPGLVSQDADRVIEIAREHGALGWKVNGAGGEGGSITVLGGPTNGAKRAFQRALREADAKYQVIPTYLSRQGLRRWIAGSGRAGRRD